jgi:hypothetical protein
VTTSCTPSAGQSCLTSSGETLGTAAAYFEYQLYGTGGGAVCYAYVYQDAAGWHWTCSAPRISHPPMEAR